MDQPLAGRRQIMLETIAPAGEPHLVASDGVVGPGRAFCVQVAARQLEGVIAKRLASRYRPGTRSGAWIKIKWQDAGARLERYVQRRRTDPGRRNLMADNGI